MTLAEIKALVLSADPNAEHYDSARKGSAYTVWREYGDLPMMADGEHQGGVRFQIDRYTKTENDATAAAIKAALEASYRVAYSYLVDYEPETRYIHHIYDCEGI